MPWSTRDTMSLREEFVSLALQDGANRRELCRRFGISAQTGYKWIARYKQLGSSGLSDLSRRPQSSPAATAQALQQAVVALRLQHPAWGGRKLSERLHTLGHPRLAPSTVNSILHRHGLISSAASAAATPWQRFERERPNALWQIDFKGHFPLASGRCHPLTLLDDHSRFNLAIRACPGETSQAVEQHLVDVFRRYGMPEQINADNGAPWGVPSQPGQLSGLAVWLIRCGVRVSFSRPYHPQTNGKDERFHRTLKAEVLQGRVFSDLGSAQQAFDLWRDVYNQQRPHQGIAMQTPMSRYQASPRCYPEVLPEIEYGPGDTVMTVKWLGELRFRGRRYRVSNALRGLPVAVRPHGQTDGLFNVFFMHHWLQQIDLRAH
ncbi:IS481 family transposase [Xylophilus rhododendri]|uniref:IS481 family transposase n=1 Tax=Xylophilus rhododendri TaxID=2697032 RepID=A0A857J6A1_9BURK|nr:IS481 family transposase [Xylophilus rhododendri]QHI99247.1 IS481 family transposase [Xylophilus rhododendri]